mmetsp:Transcript_96770/g.252237  ORF Transcript_96770/g.252237 Transcript_96770/m.252237 type:complete len:259 (+) Transcript_96770:1257-2033(+)
MHTVLGVQQHGPDALRHQACEHRLPEVLVLGEVGEHRGGQLALVPDEDGLLAASGKRHQGSRLRSLRTLVDEDRAEPDLVQGRAGGTDARGADHLCLLQLFPAAVERILFHVLADALRSAHAHDVQAAFADALDQVVDGGVAVRGHQHRQLHQPVLHEGRDDLHGGRGLASARGTLNERDPLGARPGQSLHLTTVQRGRVALKRAGLLEALEGGVPGFVAREAAVPVHDLQRYVRLARLRQCLLDVYHDELPQAGSWL